MRLIPLFGVKVVLGNPCPNQRNNRPQSFHHISQAPEALGCCSRNTEVEMTLDEALSILAESHTQWDPEVGFTVQAVTSPEPRFDTGTYVRAWEAVRMHLGMNINPSPSPSPTPAHG